MHREFSDRVHNCELAIKSDVALPSFLPLFFGSSRWFGKWRLWCLMSNKHLLYRKWIDSLAAVKRERRRQCHLPNWWIIHPYSPVRFVWEIVMTVVYAVAFTTIPFMISFVVSDYESVRLDKLNIVIYAFFWIDILLNCITGVENKKEMSVNLRQMDIFKSYLRGFLLLDVLTSLPYDHITYPWRTTAGYDSSLMVAIINLIPLLKISRYVTFHDYIFQLCMHLQIKDFAHQMFSVLVLSVYVIHWFTCFCYVTPMLFMYGMGITIDDCNDCWVKSVAKEDIPARYRLAFFIVLENFVASGFGAIEPRSQGHTIICTVLMIVGPIFEGYIVIMFLQISARSKAAELKYREIINQLLAYTRQKQLPPYMKRRLLVYYRYRFRNSYFREKNILASLSEELREEILLHSCRRLVENVAVFRNLPKDILASIVANLKFELYLPNDVIVKAGAQGDCMFFLASGSIAVFTPIGKEVCHLDDGAHFGEIALLVQDQRRVASVIAIEVCEVYRLDRRDFRKCIAVHSELFSEIEQIAAERMERTLAIEEQHKHSLNTATRSMSGSIKRARGYPGK